MRMSELAEAVEIIAAAIPDCVDLDDAPRATQLVVELAYIAGYRASEIAPVVDDILERARAARLNRAGAREEMEALHGH
jgi:hypothetical protein